MPALYFMIFDSCYKVLKHPITAEMPAEMKPFGLQRLYKFQNGYGASVVRFGWRFHDNVKRYASNTLNDRQWELAVIRWVSPRRFELSYDTPITSDILGYLTKQDVEEVLEKIRKL